MSLGDIPAQLEPTPSLFRSTLYNPLTRLWRTAEASLPFGRYHSSVVQYGNTFLVVGGNIYPDSAANTDEILQFNPDEETWTVREERLSPARGSAMAVLGDPRSFVENGLCY